MQDLINDLLAYARLGNQGKPFEATDCNPVLDQVVSNLQSAIEDNGALVTHDNLPTVDADAVQLAQLFQNLIANAIKFHGSELPQVHVSAELKGDSWVFSIRDNGIGLEPDYADRIFGIFQRVGRQRYWTVLRA